jgi:hypothetical protein
MAPSEAGGGGGAPGAAFFTPHTARAGAATASLSMQQTRINTLFSNQKFRKQKTRLSIEYIYRTVRYGTP